MASLPQPLHALPAAIYRWREANADDGLRPHLGASLIGHPCARYLWLSFRWARAADFDGRTLRLFDRGQREEATLVAELRGIGAEVSECTPDGTQYRVEACGGHVGGSMDGVARNLPGGSPLNWEVLEFKTHNAKSFKEVTDKGVEKAKRQHWAQMQVYMALTGMKRANYIAVCKDDDQIYHERVHADDQGAKAFLERAESIVFAAEPPPGVSTDPAWYQCKLCQFHSQCHGDVAPLPTCRSCCHATPERAGHWQCEFHNAAIPTADQKAGCGAHRYIPILLSRFADLVDADASANWARYRLKDGSEFVNGHPPEGVTSVEIHAAQDKRMLTDAGVQAFRATFDARAAA
jgi:hypothetical protein